MGRTEFGEKLGMSGSTAWYWLQQFKADSMIDIKTTSQGSIITVKEWDTYQKVDSNVDNKKTIKKQQKNTNNNVKNVKNSNNVPSGGESTSASASGREDSTNIQPLVGKKTTEESTTPESEEYGNKYVNWLEGFLDDNLKEGCPTAKYRKSVRNVIWNIVQILTRTKTNKHRLPTFKENMLRFWKWYKANRLDQGYQPQYIETVLANVKKYDKLCEKKYNEKHRN
jgi:hypothetical protein